MPDRPCRYRSKRWQFWKPKRRQWYGGITQAGYWTTEYLSCGCGCGTKKPGYGVRRRREAPDA